MVDAFSAFITKDTKYGLFDDNNDLRYVSFDIGEMIMKRAELKWGRVRRIEVTERGIKFGRWLE
jgi:hypothetical protein